MCCISKMSQRKSLVNVNKNTILSNLQGLIASRTPVFKENGQNHIHCVYLTSTSARKTLYDPWGPTASTVFTWKATSARRNPVWSMRSHNLLTELFANGWNSGSGNILTSVPFKAPFHVVHVSLLVSGIQANALAGSCLHNGSILSISVLWKHETHLLSSTEILCALFYYLKTHRHFNWISLSWTTNFSC